MRKLLVILGSTATGKTDLALQLAHKFQGELISADSRQVYKGLDIGTGKMPNQLTINNDQLIKGKGYWQIDGIKIWMYDVTDPKEQYNVALFVKEAESRIQEILTRKKLPILVGGTGLYIQAIVEGLSNLSVSVNVAFRKKLEKLSKENLQIKLQKISPGKWENLNDSDRQNPRRLIRAIELAGTKRTKVAGQNYDTLKIGLTAKREILYQRIDEHVISRLDHGMIEEVNNLHKNGLSVKRMNQLGLEYGVLADYLTAKINEKDLIKTLQGKIHDFARRQITWFKKAKDIIWFDITAKDFLVNVEKQVAKWYYQADES